MSQILNRFTDNAPVDVGRHGGVCWRFLSPCRSLHFFVKVLTALSVCTAHAADPVDFVRDVRPIFETHCYDCHSGIEQESGFRLDIKSVALKGGDRHGPDIVPGNADQSPLIKFIMSDDVDSKMPPDGQLTDKEIEVLCEWINKGAVWPDGVDRVELEDKRDHWSFKPLIATVVDDKIDRFVAVKLEENGLEMSGECEPVAWLRRVTFDLTGLPPTPDEVQHFQQELAQVKSASSIEQVYAAVVERLLTSERYGERWAQHWLDVVRYADTHGFEVNTERPNAWPYRDYVIRALNNDTPYDRFIKEQIVGDALGEDVATGFLVTASVLLPGQIGKDAPSIRLARQDSIDEIVNNIGQTFLGLSIGCARCHDHKFDPITAKDYYAMQAFVAGVEYEDRLIHSADTDQRESEIAALREQTATIDGQLAQFVPIAKPNSQRRVTDAGRNVESFAAVEAKFVRFTIHDANLHPSLGLIEPCIDEFEIFTDESQLRNLALATHGTKVTASGSNQSPSHQLEHINDGLYGNSRSWMSSEAGRGWVLFELPEVTRITNIVWSRDRERIFNDRLATAFTLEAGLTEKSLNTLATVEPLRPTINWKLTVDRFAPVKTNKVRFTILATNSLEPCIDEFEIIDTSGQNVARQASVKTSSSMVVPGRHDPSFINDGQYGKERSWLGNDVGKGWVELEFPIEMEITRVDWSRDRTGKFEDRMTTEYRIEVSRGDEWQIIADSTDRRPFIAGAAIDPIFILSGLPTDDAKSAGDLLGQKQQLEAQIKMKEQGQLAFAGKFRTPDEIRLLNRGDPEQPTEEVVPAVLSAFAGLSLPRGTPEQERRKALADWIASPQNPLTARVMVNRIWQGHFGSGLVQTPSDFGRSGMKPTHPELLDWLAAEFIRSGWSMKHMHRLIVLSKTYRQSSALQSGPNEKDAEVRLLWRYPSRRLEGEAIRDAMLAVSGRLNLQMGGAGYNLFEQRGGLSGFKPIEQLTSENQRRMIYSHKVRRETEAVFGAFDCPDAGQSTALRRASMTPIQALNLFNSSFTLQLSDAFAERVRTESSNEITQWVEATYQLALNRSPTPDESRDVEPVVRQHGLAVLCRAIFNSNEFVFLP